MKTPEKVFCVHIPSIHMLVGAAGSLNLPKAELDKEFINAPEQPFWLTI
jgi:hypothetical protein